MIRFVFSYDDIRSWLFNYFDLDLRLWAYSADSGAFMLKTPPVGVPALLPSGLLNYQQYFHIDEYDATGITLYVFFLGGHDEMMNNLLVRYINYCWGAEVLEQLPRGRVKLHLERIQLIHDIQLQSIGLSAEGIAMEFECAPEIARHLQMLQMFLRAGYKDVRIVPDDELYRGYWFSDDALHYTLTMADHPADIRLWTSFYLPDWLDWQDVITEDFFEPSYPNESITFNNGEVTVGIPLTIAEPEINAQTMERNCNRLRLEVGAAMTAVLYYLPNENTNNIF